MHLHLHRFLHSGKNTKNDEMYADPWFDGKIEFDESENMSVILW